MVLIIDIYIIYYIPINMIFHNDDGILSALMMIINFIIIIITWNGILYCLHINNNYDYNKIIEKSHNYSYNDKIVM